MTDFFGVFVGVLLAMALVFVALAIATVVVVANINDINAVGANFWNVFWILLVGAVLFSGAAAASK